MKKLSLKNNVLTVVLLSLMLTTSGCFYLVIGGVGALGGYAISPDTVEGNVEGQNTQSIWEAAVHTVAIMGVIEEKDEISGVLIAKVQGTQISISISETVPDIVKLRVKARKGMMPKVKLAQDIYTKIVQAAH